MSSPTPAESSEKDNHKSLFTFIKLELEFGNRKSEVGILESEENRKSED